MTGGTASSYSWNFGSGQGTAEGVTASHTYSADGSYDVTLSAVVGGVTITKTKTITVRQTVAPIGPTASFTYIADSANSLKINFTSTSTGGSSSISSWQWDFGVSGATGGSQSISYTYPASNTYTVKLTVTDANDLSSTDTKAITVTAPPAPAPTVSGKVVIPAGLAYSSARVCFDTNGDKSCTGETVAAVGADGNYTLPELAGYPVVAEFFTGTSSLMSLGSGSFMPLRPTSLTGAPVLVYETPAGRTLVSALTTLVKNRMDLDPTYTLEAAEKAVQADTGMGNLYSAASYSGDGARINNMVSNIAQGLLDHVKNLLGTDYNFSSTLVTMLNGIVYDMILEIADNSGKTADDFVSDAEFSAGLGDATSIENGLSKTEDTLNNNSGTESLDFLTTFTAPKYRMDLTDYYDDPDIDLYGYSMYVRNMALKASVNYKGLNIPDNETQDDSFNAPIINDNGTYSFNNQGGMGGKIEKAVAEPLEGKTFTVAEILCKLRVYYCDEYDADFDSSIIPMFDKAKRTPVTFSAGAKGYTLAMEGIPVSASDIDFLDEHVWSTSTTYGKTTVSAFVPEVIAAGDSLYVEDGIRLYLKPNNRAEFEVNTGGVLTRETATYSIVSVSGREVLSVQSRRRIVYAYFMGGKVYFQYYLAPGVKSTVFFLDRQAVEDIRQVWGSQITRLLISFDPQGGTPWPQSYSVELGARLGPLPVVTRNGYDFKGWFDSYGNEFTPSSGISASVTLKAKWTKQGVVSDTVTAAEFFGTRKAFYSLGYELDGLSGAGMQIVEMDKFHARGRSAGLSALHRSMTLPFFHDNESWEQITWDNDSRLDNNTWIQNVYAGDNGSLAMPGEHDTVRFFTVKMAPLTALQSNPNFGHSVCFSEGAEGYTITMLASPNVDTIAHIKSTVNSSPENWSFFHGKSLNSDFFINGNTITANHNRGGRISFEQASKTFTWNPNVAAVYEVYNPFILEPMLPKSGTYTVTGTGTNAEYTFTAEDGSVFYFFFTADGRGWLAEYPIDSRSMMFFNDTAAKDIRDQWPLPADNGTFTAAEFFSTAKTIYGFSYSSSSMYEIETFEINQSGYRKNYEVLSALKTSGILPIVNSSAPMDGVFTLGDNGSLVKDNGNGKGTQHTLTVTAYPLTSLTSGAQHGSKTVNFSEGAVKYEVVTDHKKDPVTPYSLNYLKANMQGNPALDHLWFNGTCDNGGYVLNGAQIYPGNPNWDCGAIVMDPDNDTFYYKDYKSNDNIPFSSGGAVHKEGTYTVNADGYTFSAEDGSVFYFFTNSATTWLITYHTVERDVQVFFNDIAAMDIIDQWQLTNQPLDSGTFTALNFLSTQKTLHELAYEDGGFKMRTFEFSTTQVRMSLYGSDSYESYPAAVNGDSSLTMSGRRNSRVMSTVNALPVSGIFAANPNFGGSVKFPDGAVRYEVTARRAAIPDNISYLKANIDDLYKGNADMTGDMGGVTLSGNSILSGSHYQGNIDFDPATMTFRWSYPWAHRGDSPFNMDPVPDKSGTYTVSGQGNDIEYMFTANDGSVFYLFYSARTAPDGWTLAAYDMGTYTYTYFNDAGIEAIKNSWDGFSMDNITITALDFRGDKISVADPTLLPQYGYSLADIRSWLAGFNPATWDMGGWEERVIEGRTCIILDYSLRHNMKRLVWYVNGEAYMADFKI